MGHNGCGYAQFGNAKYKLIKLQRMNERDTNLAEKMKILNLSELSRLITGGDRSAIRPNKIPKKWWRSIDNLIYKELPAWWEQKKNELNIE